MKALIFGAGGQDGSYLSEFLLNKGYHVWGVVRYSTTNSYNNLQVAMHIPSFTLVKGDFTDYTFVKQILDKVQPDEVYNLAAQSHVGKSFELPGVTARTNHFAVQHLFRESMKNYPSIKIYQASTSEMFGTSEENPKDENTYMSPVSPYAKTKLDAHRLAQQCRKEGLFVSCGILFNHESPRRGNDFVTKKITNYVRGLANALRKESLAIKSLKLGNLSAKRDWGYAPEYVEAIWMMLQRGEPDDFVIGTGESHSVEEFAKLAFELVQVSWKDFVEIDQTLYRTTDIDLLCANPTKAHEVLGWHHTTDFQHLVEIMVGKNENYR